MWLITICLMTQSKSNGAALELKRTVGVAYPTAWLIKYKLMGVMSVREAGRVLTGRVEADDAFLGGVHAGKRRAGRRARYRCSSRRGPLTDPQRSSHSQTVTAAVGRDLPGR